MLALTNSDRTYHDRAALSSPSTWRRTRNATARRWRTRVTSTIPPATGLREALEGYKWELGGETTASARPSRASRTPSWPATLTARTSFVGSITTRPWASLAPTIGSGSRSSSTVEQERGNAKDPGDPGVFRSFSLPTYGRLVIVLEPSWRRRRAPAHNRPEPLVISKRAMVPIGTTFSTPVKAVPPGDTVVGATTGLVVLLLVVVDVIDFGLTGCVTLVVVVGCVTLVVVVGCVTLVVVVGCVTLVVVVGCVTLVVVVGCVTLVVVVGCVTLVVVVGCVTGGMQVPSRYTVTVFASVSSESDHVAWAVFVADVAVPGTVIGLGLSHVTVAGWLASQLCASNITR